MTYLNDMYISICYTITYKYKYMLYLEAREPK